MTPLESAKNDANMRNAAYDMYEALLYMMHCHREPHDSESEVAWEQARQALTKAKGIT